jgi:hypothetical protein
MGKTAANRLVGEATPTIVNSSVAVGRPVAVDLSGITKGRTGADESPRSAGAAGGYKKDPPTFSPG